MDRFKTWWMDEKRVIKRGHWIGETIKSAAYIRHLIRPFIRFVFTPEKTNPTTKSTCSVQGTNTNVYISVLFSLLFKKKGYYSTVYLQ